MAERRKARMRIPKLVDQAVNAVTMTGMQWLLLVFCGPFEIAASVARAIRQMRRTTRRQERERND